MFGGFQYQRQLWLEQIPTRFGEPRGHDACMCSWSLATRVPRQSASDARKARGSQMVEGTAQLTYLENATV